MTHQSHRRDARNQHQPVLRHGPKVKAVQLLVEMDWMILMMRMMSSDPSTWTWMLSRTFCIRTRHSRAEPDRRLIYLVAWVCVCPLRHLLMTSSALVSSVAYFLYCLYSVFCSVIVWVFYCCAIISCHIIHNSHWLAVDLVPWLGVICESLTFHIDWLGALAGCDMWIIHISHWLAWCLGWVWYVIDGASHVDDSGCSIWVAQQLHSVLY